MSNVPALFAKSAAYRPVVATDFTIFLPFDLDETEKCDFLNLIQGVKNAIIPRDHFSKTFEPYQGVHCDCFSDYKKRMHKAGNRIQEAYDLVQASLNAATGEDSYALLRKVPNQLKETMSWLSLAEEELKHFKTIYGGQFNEQDKKEYQTYVDEFNVAMAKTKDVHAKLCTRLGPPYCYK